MSLPLYKDHDSPGKLPGNAHAGLWFERFFNHYQKNWDIDKTDKSKWIQGFSGNKGDPKQLKHYSQRQQNLVDALNGQSHRYKTDWHLVTGMGNPHPVENGFSWHATLAVPYLSGATVKGLVRAWVEGNDDNLSDTALEQRLQHWFGTADKKQVPEQSGAFIFFDAIPDQPPALLCDIMTPHMGNWYQNDNGSTKSADIPADWHEPVPVSFLAVRRAQFIFSIAPRKPGDKTQLPAVFEALENALNWLGAGAKTATGYGYMTEDRDFFENRQKQQQQQAEAHKQQQQLAERIKHSSPLAKEYFTQAAEQAWEQNKDRVWQNQVLDPWLDKLEQQQQPDEEIVQHLQALVEGYFPGLLAEPEKTSGRKEKPVFKERQRKFAHRLNALIDQS